MKEPSPRAFNRSAMALLVVLVLVMMASLSAYGFTFYMESQYRTARTFEEQVHARQAAMNATELVAAMLELPRQQRAALGGLENNPAMFRDQMMEAKLSASLQDDNSNYWRASVLAPSLNGQPSKSVGVSARASDSPGEFVFGLENETAKIPLTELLQWDQRTPGHAKQVLLRLPGATEPIVNAYLQSIGSQSTMATGADARRVGRIANRNSLNQPSALSMEQSINNSDGQRLQDQLQLLWLGGDLNQNFRLDSLDAAWSAKRVNQAGASNSALASRTNSTSTSSSTQVQSSRETSVVGLAWQRYLTWNSGTRNESQSGQARVDLNQPDLANLHQQLSKIWPTEWADFVVVYRQYGGTPPANSGSTAAATSVAGPPDFSAPASRTIRTPLELVGIVSQVPNTGSRSDKSGKRQVSSPFQPEISQMGNYLSKLLDDVTTQSGSTSRIDVNHASLPVIMAIPGMDRQLADAIIQRRNDLSRNGQNNDATSSRASDTTVAWLLQDGVVDLQRLKALEPYMTGGSDVYSCQVVGYRDDQSAVYRCTLAIDARQRPAIKRNIQTWHSWDRGFTTAELHSQR